MFIRTLLAGLVLFTGFTLAPAIPVRPPRGDSAATQVAVIVPGAVASFQNHRLEVVLYEYDPLARGVEVVFDRHVSEAFSHNRGADTVLQLMLGGSRLMTPGRKYYVTVDAFSRQGKRVHIGEKDGKRGTSFVLAEGAPSRVTLVVRAAKVADVVFDIADEIKKGNETKAKQMALARTNDFEEFYDMAELYRGRTKTGIGWGSKKLEGVPPNQDGLEFRLRTLERGVPANFIQDAANNEEASYWLSALAELTIAKVMPFKQVGQKSKIDWNNRAVMLRKQTDEFRAALATKNPQVIQGAARAINNTCNDCHAIYRE